MSGPYGGGPRAPESNPPINPQYYQPRVYTISAIETGPQTMITTSVDHDYVIGQVIRLLIPSVYGANQITGQQGNVIDIPETDQVIVTINSQLCDAFIPTPTYGPTPPQIIAIADVNTGYISTNGRDISLVTIPGAFINISPI